VYNALGTDILIVVSENIIIPNIYEEIALNKEKK
jgi:hypothetical protein